MDHLLNSGDIRVFMVGGAVRDHLLGRTVNDRDWVVVGASVQALISAGFRQVGADFPVFLHPQTQEEYALARTERKTGQGYLGFEVQFHPGVTLEEDLSRRDLTINAMAIDRSGNLIDPHGGRSDLQARVLRHVGPAFEEDPVRILRIARFCARHPEFNVAPETMALMRSMVQRGDVDHLVPERIWKEISRGLMEDKPSRMFETLRECGALSKIFPELDRLWGVPQPPKHHPEIDTGVHAMMVIDQAARLSDSLNVRFAALTHDLGKGLTPPDVLPRHILHEQRSADLIETLCDRWKVPSEHKRVALINAKEHTNIHRSLDLGASALLRLFERCGAIQHPERFAEVLLACEADARGRAGLENEPYPQRERLLQTLSFARINTAGVSAKAVALGLKGEKIGDFIRSARVHALQAGLQSQHEESPSPTRGPRP